MANKLGFSAAESEKTKREQKRLQLLRSTTYSVIGLAAGLLLSNAAHAQTKIEQMIVTAQKRAQDVQTVPASISAFSGEALENRQIKTLSDLTSATPNFSVASGGGGATTYQLSIRGVSMDGSSAANDQPVALHIDGVYQPRTSNLFLVMSDLEAVEVLRGPQGTLYGRNANAGVINLITRKPTDTFEGSATVFGGSFARYGARGYVSGPVADNISMRLSGVIDRNEGWGDNLYTGNSVSGENAYGARLSVRLKPVEDVTVDISASTAYSHTSNASYLVSASQSGPNMDALRNAGQDIRYTSDPWELYSTFDPEQTNIIQAVTGTISWDVAPNITLKSITGWQHTNFWGIVDSDRMPTNFIISLYGTAPTHTISQEFNLNAKLWDRLDTVVGLYYLNDWLYNLGSTNDFPLGSPLGTNPTQTGANLFVSQNAKSKAAFLDATFSVFDDLRLVAGIRRTFDDKYSVIRANTLRRDNGVITNPGCGFARVEPPLNYHSTTGKIGVQYDFTPEIMGYVQWQNGFKTGGWNPSTNCDDKYDPETIYSWEAGIKSTIFNGSTTLNVTAFDYRYSNMQMFRSIFNPAGAAIALVDNAARASITGLEIELNSYVTDALRVNVGVGMLDPKYGDGISAVNGATGVNVLTNISGNQVARAPKLTLNAGVEYTMRVGDFGDLTMRGEYNYVSRTYYTIFNEAIAKQDGYSLWNAIFTFTPDDSCLSFKAFARNITDKAVRLGAFPSPTLRNATQSWQPPRTFGGEVTAKF